MNSPWQLYDDLIEGIPVDLTVKYYQGAITGTRVISSEDSMGLAMSIPVITRLPLSQEQTLEGRPLQEVAKLVKSWNFMEAAIGLAAINSWYNQPQRAQRCGFVHPSMRKMYAKPLMYS